MSSIGSLAGIAAAIGEPARAAMLVTLMDGRALTAGELADAAGIMPSTASGHLSRLLDAGLLALQRQGRHRYYRLASTSVAAMLEGMMALDATVAVPRKAIVTGPRDRALRRARVCYDHLAGEIAVAIADRMVVRGELDFANDGGILTAKGQTFLARIGVELPAPRSSAHAYCRPCLDWSERRPHVAGTIGAAILRTFVEHNWVRRSTDRRAVTVTPLGLTALDRHFDLGATRQA